MKSEFVTDPGNAATPTLALVHGWGLHSGCWDGITAGLRRDHAVAALDLPGHGDRSGLPRPYTLEAVAAELASQVRSPAIWVGWSLGAMVVMALARHFPHQVAALVLVGATPRFVAGPDWPHGLPAAEFEGFAASLLQDYDATLQRFLSLQVTRDDQGRATLRELRAQMQRRPAPRLDALTGGLDILQGADLRASAAGITVPTLLIHGSRDRLVPEAASAFLAQAIKGAQREIIAGAGHAPMLSHPHRFESVLRGFVAGVSSGELSP
jgi:pimeloyl-[acyl-carrier protein] methyl ester esterase